MKKNRLAFTVVCLLALPILHGQILATTPDKPGKRQTRPFELKVHAGYDQIVSKVNNQTFSVYDAAGNTISSETIEEESLSYENDLLRPLNTISTLGIEVSYNVWNNLCIHAGIGVSQLSAITDVRESGVEVSRSLSANVAPTYMGGLSYGYSFTDRLFIRVQPAIRYTKVPRMIYQNYQEQVGEMPDSRISQSQSHLSLEVPVVVGYAFGKWVPYVGIAYKDYMIHSKLEFQKTYIGESYPVSLKSDVSSKSIIHGMAGVNFFFAPNISLGLTAVASTTFSAQLGLNIGL